MQTKFGYIQAIATPPAEVIRWQFIQPPHNREHVIWRHGPPRPTLALHYPDHLAGRLWNPDTGEVFDLPPELDPVGNIPGGLSGLIAPLMSRMLAWDPEVRPSADELLDLWQGAFEIAVGKAHELDGRAM